MLVSFWTGAAVVVTGIAVRLWTLRRPQAQRGAHDRFDGARRSVDDDDVAMRLVAETMMVRHGIAPRHRDAVVAEVRDHWTLTRAWLHRRYGPTREG